MSTPRSLYLCRTPFQLLLCQQIVATYPDEAAELLYITDLDGPKDRQYFDASAKAFSERSYRVTRSKTDVLSFILGDGRALRRQFASIALGNHTLSHFRWLVARNPKAKVRTFDEGAGNFHRSGALHHDTRSGVERWRDRVLRVPSMGDVFNRSTIHFTVNASLDNVVPSDRLKQVDLLKIGDAASAPPVNVIIGQPFHEFLNADECHALRTAFDALPHGRYVKHPREAGQGAFPEGLDVISSDPRILEHYVGDLVSAGHPVRLIGAHSTSFFTINSPAVEKYYLHVGDFQDFADMLSGIGCRVFDLNVPDGREMWADTAAAWA